MANAPKRRELKRQTTEAGFVRNIETRGNSHQRGYDHDWMAVRDMRRELDENLCQHCLAEGGLIAAMQELARSSKYHTVDHIVPVHVRPDWRLDVGNTQVLCDRHNAMKTHADNAKYGSREATSLSPIQLKNRADAQLLPYAPRSI